MPSASRTANTRGPLRRAVGDTFVGRAPARVLSCGHVVVTTATHTSLHRCTACLRRSRAADAALLSESTSSLARNLRRAMGVPEPVMAIDAMEAA